jgi:hypothetical protein
MDVTMFRIFHMSWNSRPSVRPTAALAIAALLVLGTSVPSPGVERQGGSAGAERPGGEHGGLQHGDGARGGGDSHRGGENHHYRPPPVVYGSPYCYPPPLIYHRSLYDTPPCLGIAIP